MSFRVDQTAAPSIVPKKGRASSFPCLFAATLIRPIVLDFQTKPGIGSTWQKYDKPDPAFILPWYGYPVENEEDLPFPGASVTPTCGEEKKLFSHDIIIDPPFASVGETVTISATVRNFSHVPAGNVDVSFFRGEPVANNLIGTAVVKNLDRADGPGEAAITWTVEGAGEQKIYAMIDPESKLPEMHEDGDIINNNLAYSLMQIGDASYFDVGAAKDQPYDFISYDQGENLTVTLFMPPDSLEATTKLELHDVDRAIPGVGNPFELLAKQGSDECGWAEPIAGFDLKKAGSNDAPAVMMIDYAGTRLTQAVEEELKLWYKSGTVWIEANKTCDPAHKILRFPQDNLFAVPICKTGMFIVGEQPPGPVKLMLPVVMKK